MIYGGEAKSKNCFWTIAVAVVVILLIVGVYFYNKSDVMEDDVNNFVEDVSNCKIVDGVQGTEELSVEDVSKMCSEINDFQECNEKTAVVVLNDLLQRANVCSWVE